jgi:hypothetical protein
MFESYIYHMSYVLFSKSQDSSVGIANRLRAGRPRNWGSMPGRYKIFFSSPQRPDRLWTHTMSTGVASP